MLTTNNFRSEYKNNFHEVELTGALSRAVTARAGGAHLKPMVAASILPALDSNPSNIIDRGWGQDGLCKTTKSSIRKSCPNLTETRLSAIPVANWSKSSADARRKSRTPASAFGARTAASAATPPTDRGVEIREDRE